MKDIAADFDFLRLESAEALPEEPAVDSIVGLMGTAMWGSVGRVASCPLKLGRSQHDW